MARRAARKDRPHAAIKATFEAYGWAVLDVAPLAEAGCDLVVWKPQQGAVVRLWLVEVKDADQPPSKRTLTDNEVRMARAHAAVYRVVGSVDEAVALARA